MIGEVARLARGVAHAPNGMRGPLLSRHRPDRSFNLSHRRSASSPVSANSAMGNRREGGWYSLPIGGHHEVVRGRDGFELKELTRHVVLNCLR